MQKFKRIFTYIIIDSVSAFVFIHLFFSEFVIKDFNSLIFSISNFVFLITLYALGGTYVQITRKSRFKECIRTINHSIITLSLYVALDSLIDFAVNKEIYTFLKLAFYHFLITYTLRLIFLTFIKRQVQSGNIGYNTIIIGNNEKSLQVYQEIITQKKIIGFKFIGFVDLCKDSTNNHFLNLPYLGNFDKIDAIIREFNIEETIVSINVNQQDKLKFILDELEKTGVIINIIPDVKDILSGIVKLNYLFSVPLITIHKDNMPFWQRIFKTTADYLLSLIVLVLLSPLFIIITLLIKIGSKGSAIYKQERIGKNGIPFYIYKFRTMFTDSEKHGPMLSKLDDIRVTPIGKLLRKTRLDELPQFVNILKGEMSLVGPRPERQFYIDQIVKKAPHYHYLHKVLPGITSWGQVKFGYAENVEQMINRLTFDILYVENRSLALDFKIILYTVVIVLQGRGK